MKPGAYAFCRPIEGTPAQHQFVVLVPSSSSGVAGWTRDIDGVRCCVLGAYDLQGCLRARRFADSDVGFLKRKLRDSGDPAIQSSKIEIQQCLVGNEDPFLAQILKSYVRYRGFEGKKDEILYPSGKNLLGQILSHFSSSSFNSNSWAQSLIFWAEMAFAPAKAIRDFSGLDVGNDRLIPRRYFLA